MDHGLLALIAVQIVGEALPISSSGHLALVDALFFKKLNVLPEHFDHFFHGPTIVVVLCFFWRAWWGPVRYGAKALWRLLSGERWCTLPYSNRCLLTFFMRVGVMVVVADCVTAVFYWLIRCEGIARIISEATSMVMLGIGFCVTASVLVSSWFATRFVGTRSMNNVKISLILGLTQGLALLPGISRFAVTTVAAQWLGLSPRRAMQFSFLMFFPLMCAAFVFHGLPLVISGIGEGPLFFIPGIDPESILSHFLSLPTLGVILSATLLSYGALALSYRLVITHRLWWFGVYMLVPIILAVLE